MTTVASSPSRTVERPSSASKTTPTLSAATLLGQIAADRGLVRSSDLLSTFGEGATTIWRINAAQSLVVCETRREAVIDDAYECGRIAATAALSAVHATTARPLFARLVVECPSGASDAARRALLDGAAVAMSEAGAVLADARFVEGPTLRLGALVVGSVRPDRMRDASGARPGDALIVAGSLGTGIYQAAHARSRLGDDDRSALIVRATRSSRAAVALGTLKNVHAVTGVGPEGLIAALLAMARAARVTARIRSLDVPAMPRALALARTGCVAPEASRNWNRDGASVRLDDTVMPEMRALLTDPSASGALLIACKPESVARVLKIFADDGGLDAAQIGTLASSPADEGTSTSLLQVG